MEPSISVVMPCRNGERYIREAIESIRAQTIATWELIVVNDNSTPEDASAEIVSSFHDGRIRYFSLPNGHGRNVACARNFGNAVSRAPFIAVADADDTSYPGRLQEIVSVLSTGRHDVFYSDFDVWDEAEGCLVDTSSYPAMPMNLEAMKRYDLVPHGSVAYTRETCFEYPYNSFFTRSGDYDLFTRMASHGKRFHYSPNKTYRYRLHASNLTKRIDSELFNAFLKQCRGWRSFDETVAERIARGNYA